MPAKAKSMVVSISAGSGCYRHLKISDQATLEELSDEILEAFDFINDHAHAFFLNNRPWTDDDCFYAEFVDEDDEYRHTCDYTLRKAGLYADKKFVYVFDFGEDWEFRCRVLKILDEQTKIPEVIRSKGEPPKQYAPWNENGI